MQQIEIAVLSDGLVDLERAEGQVVGIDQLEQVVVEQVEANAAIFQVETDAVLDAGDGAVFDTPFTEFTSGVRATIVDGKNPVAAFDNQHLPAIHGNKLFPVFREIGNAAEFDHKAG